MRLPPLLLLIAWALLASAACSRGAGTSPPPIGAGAPVAPPAAPSIWTPEDVEAAVGKLCDALTAGLEHDTGVPLDEARPRCALAFAEPGARAIGVLAADLPSDEGDWTAFAIGVEVDGVWHLTAAETDLALKVRSHAHQPPGLLHVVVEHDTREPGAGFIKRKELTVCRVTSGDAPRCGRRVIAEAFTTIDPEVAPSHDWAVPFELGAEGLLFGPATGARPDGDGPEGHPPAPGRVSFEALFDEHGVATTRL